MHTLLPILIFVPGLAKGWKKSLKSGFPVHSLLHRFKTVFSKTSPATSDVIIKKTICKLSTHEVSNFNSEISLQIRTRPLQQPIRNRILRNFYSVNK